MSARDGRGSPLGPVVLVVSHEASRTGAPKVALNLLTALRKAGARTILVYRWGGPMRKELTSAAHDGRREPLAHLRVLLRRQPVTRALARRVEVWAIRRVLDQYRPDIVWCNTVLAAIYATEATARGIPCVVYSHEGQPLAEPALTRAGLFRPDSGQARQGGPILVGCSTDTAHVLGELVGAPGTAWVLHSPVDVDQVRSEDKTLQEANLPPIVLAVGKGDVNKGIEVFNEAAMLAADLGFQWKWVGDVATDQQVHVVDYLGEVESAIPAISQTAVFVLPSLRDSFPLVVLEAMALGKPIVASRLAGTVEQLGDAGVLVEPGDASAIVGAVAELLGDPTLAANLGNAALDRCRERWDIAAFDRKVAEILSSIVR